MSINIILIGMRGSGKTTVSKILSQKLGIKIIDTDSKIEKQENIAIKDIVEKHGWEYFRDLETKLLQNLKTDDQFILSTGGGIILKKENRNLLKKLGKIFYLFAKPEILYQRIGEDKNRPILTNASQMLEDLKNLFTERKEIYESSANYVIDTENLNTEGVSVKILSLINPKLSSPQRWGSNKQRAS